VRLSKRSSFQAAKAKLREQLLELKRREKEYFEKGQRRVVVPLSLEKVAEDVSEKSKLWRKNSLGTRRGSS